MASMSHLVNFLMHQKITHIRLYDPNPDILRALSGTHIHVTISVPNNQLLAIASSNTTATSWIRRNVAAVSLGDEVLSTLPSSSPPSAPSTPPSSIPISITTSSFPPLTPPPSSSTPSLPPKPSSTKP